MGLEENSRQNEEHRSECRQRSGRHWGDPWANCLTSEETTRNWLNEY